MDVRALALAFVLALTAGGGVACAPGGPPPGSFDLSVLPSRAPVTVLVFFSARCHCMAAHDARLVALDARYRGRGVQLLVVDSERDATPERDAQEARRRGYTFPVLQDRGGAIAGRLGAEYAAYAVVLDAAGVVRYHGGIDSDRNTLHDDATPYLQDAVDDVLAGRPVRRPEGKAFGCTLETR